jgi:septal ring factor EnvC (AmiA/AmiB activator)
LEVNFKDLNTWGIFATFIGLIISIITLIIANNVRKATRNLQNSLAFDKRVPTHLKQIDSLLKDFNMLLNNIGDNVNLINAVLANLKSELLSLSNKISDKRTKKLIHKTILNIGRNLNKQFTPKIHHENSNPLIKAINFLFKVHESHYWRVYISVGEIYRSVDNLYKDKRIRIKRND